MDPVMKREKTTSKGVGKSQSSSRSSIRKRALGGTKAGWMGLRSTPVTCECQPLSCLVLLRIELAEM